MADVCIKTPVDAVILEEVGISFSVAQVVNGDHTKLLTIVVFIKRAECVAANPPKTIDRDTNCHILIPDLGVFCSNLLCDVVNITK